MNITWLTEPQPVDDEVLEFYVPHDSTCALMGDISHRCDCRTELTEQAS
jgi:hypothetical protein